VIEICNECKNDKIVLVKENKRSFKIINSSRVFINKVKVDKCFIKDGKRCDYLFEIECNNIKKVFYIELKGKDLKHAIEQILATIEVCKSSHKGIKKYAFVILSRYPKEDSSIQKQKRLLKSQGIKFKSATNLHEEVI